MAFPGPSLLRGGSSCRHPRALGSRRGREASGDLNPSLVDKATGACDPRAPCLHMGEEVLERGQGQPFPLMQLGGRHQAWTARHGRKACLQPNCSCLAFSDLPSSKPQSSLNFCWQSSLKASVFKVHAIG